MLTDFKPYSIKIKGGLYIIDQPWVMGILNTTDDSFYDGGKYHTIDNALHQAEKMLMEGAKIIDIGGQSTRPGAVMTSEEEELQRTIPVVEALAKQFPEAILSIDTFRAEVAQKAVEAGAGIVNDVSAGDNDPGMMDMVVRLGVPYIAMHKQGDPATMQVDPQYEDVTQDVLLYLKQKTDILRDKGINDVIIDPGFGFGKNLEHNYRLMKQLQLFHTLNCPLMVGVSRKSIICKLLKVNPDKALNGSTALHTIALLKGAHILRVHDVKEAMEVVKITSYYREA